MEKQKITLQTVDRALELLELMAHSGEKMSVADISKALGTTRTGAYNLLNSLMAKQYVEKDPATNKFHLGYRFVAMSANYWYQYPASRIIEKNLWKISDKWGFYVNFAIYKSPAIALYFWPKTSEQYSCVMRGGTIPAHVTAAGKVLMSDLSEEQFREDVENIEFRPYARKTITSKEELLLAVKEAKDKGYSVEREENSNNHASVACPVRDMSGRVVSAVEVGMAMDELDKNLEEILKDLQYVCMGISMELGYNPYR